MLSIVTNLGVKANLNTIDDLGVYQAFDCVNGPSGVTGYVFVHVTSANVGGNSRAVQKLWNLNSGTEYTRVKTIGSWTPWETGGGGGGGGDYDPLGTADAVMEEHLADADPHPQYLTEAEATVLFDPVGAGTAAVVAHVAESDPHSQYLNTTRGDARYDAAGAATTAVAGHVSAVDPHSQYLNTARGDARYDPVGAADAAVAAHESELDPHTQYLTQTRGDARYDAKGTAETEAASAVAAHVSASDPHTQYLNTSRGDARYDAVGAADAAVTAHESESDPHTQYYNQTRGDARYDLSGAASSAVAAHVSASDPHTQYYNQTRGDARYAPVSHTHPASAISDSTTVGRALMTAASAAAAKTTLALENVNNTADSAKTVFAFMVSDTRAVVSAPNQVTAKTGLFEFKEVASVGSPPSPASVNYAHVLTVNGWAADGAGGWPIQISWGGVIAYRQGTAPTTWGAWKTLLDTSMLDTDSSFTANSDAKVPSQKAVKTAVDAKLAASSYTAANVLAKIITVDGASSRLDADLWKGATFTVSTSAPSGGADGDFWFRREA